MIKITWYQKLRQARLDVQKTQARVGKECGISESHYQRYEYGDIVPNALLAMKLAKAVESFAEDIFVNDDED